MTLLALVSCEFSGEVRRRINARPGWEAVSVDLLPADDGETRLHIMRDCRRYLADKWDLLIGHPPCTRLANSGVRWLHKPPKNAPEGFRPGVWETMTEEGRRRHMHLRLADAASLFKLHLDAPARHIAVENPVMHKYARELIGGRRPDFTVQPWQFGDMFTKRTCFWTKDLPALVPERTEPPSPEEIAAARQRGEWDMVHKVPPSAGRWKVRSKTFPGLAKAMVDQWCAHVESKL